MPLQKPRPHGTQHHDALAQQRSLQERRRKLQTISELPVTDDVLPNFGALPQQARNGRSSYTKSAVVEKKAQSLNKRRSASPTCLQAQALSAAEPMHTKNSTSSAERPSAVSGPDVAQRGWNARREEARMQQEKAMGKTNNPQRYYAQYGWVGSEPLPPTQTPLLSSHSSHSSQSSQHSLDSHTSQSHLLRNNRSAGRHAHTIERRTSLGGTTRSTCSNDFDTEPFEHTNTDSSSHRSSHDTTSRRFQPSPSQSPLPVHTALPLLPKAHVARKQRYYSNPANMQNSLALGQQTLAHNATPNSAPRSSSMPSIQTEDASKTQQKSKPRLSRRFPSSTNTQHDPSVQKARLAALAALISSPRDSVHEPPTSSPTSPTQQSRNSQPQRSTSSSTSSTLTPTSSLRSPPPTYTPKPPTHTPLTPRTLPKRESLTQWKAEREEAKLSFGSLRRAEMKERVRRANEVERKREEELVGVGKGTGVRIKTEKKGEKVRQRGGERVGEKERGRNKGKERGCLGGALKALGWGWGGGC